VSNDVHRPEDQAPGADCADALRLVVQARDAEIEMLRLLVQKLKLQLARRNRMIFGSASERLADGAPAGQGSLLEGEPLDGIGPKKAAGAAVSPAANTAANTAANDKSVDRSLPPHLPREPQVHRPEATPEHHDAQGQPCGCGECGGRLREIGRDVSEQLEYVPGRFKVVRHVRPKLACVRCQRVFQAAAPSRPISRGLPGPALMAHVMVAKYCDHQPLYRQSGMYARDGVELGRSTLAGWVAKGDALIDPLVAAVRRYVMACEKIHGDDTPVKVLAPGTGKTRTGRLWVYVRDDRPAGDPSPTAAWFAYSPDRGGEHPQDHLRGFRGALQADAYSGWPRLFATGQVQEVACWAHARRPWWDLFLSAKRDPDSLAAQALGRIRALYAIEDQIRGQPPDVRRAQRQARAGPLLEAMRSWLEELLPRVSAKSDLAQAIGYSLARWTALTRYVDDGRLEIDNNAAERALRGVSLGRKNYLFMGSDADGQRAAAFYSLVETAKLNGLDPEAYLRTVFERIAERPINRIDELLPWNIALATVANRVTKRKAA
jgi:transposase